ncbi:MAG: hypothetical protein HOC74_18430 [Gemmatimonadetes bacterium]|jgi:hypothetical protein|nr:hypothetical protein [Gemmatimonadota bacterium]
MAALSTVPYRVQAAGAPEKDLLITREVGYETKEQICRELAQLEPNTVLDLDFRAIRFMDVSCADEMIVRILARLEAGEYPDRFITLSHIDVQHRENIEAALKIAKKTTLVRQEESWEVLGELVSSHRTALAKIMEMRSVTARELQQELDYNTINESSTRLTFLYQRCLVAREPFREAVRGGGRQFRYLSLNHPN